MKLTDKEKWRHMKHFLDTHDYNESNLNYLKSWIETFTVPPKQSEHDIDNPKLQELVDTGTIIQDTENPMLGMLPDLEDNPYENVSDESKRYETISDNSLPRTNNTCTFMQNPCEHANASGQCTQKYCDRI